MEGSAYLLALVAGMLWQTTGKEGWTYYVSGVLAGITTGIIALYFPELAAGWITGAILANKMRSRARWLGTASFVLIYVVTAPYINLVAYILASAATYLLMRWREEISPTGAGIALAPFYGVQTTVIGLIWSLAEYISGKVRRVR